MLKVSLKWVLKSRLILFNLKNLDKFVSTDFKTLIVNRRCFFILRWFLINAGFVAQRDASAATREVSLNRMTTFICR